MKKFVILGAFAFVVVVQLAFVVVYSNGIPGETNAPGETNCTSCHVTYPLNSAGGSVVISVLACLNNTYIPGQTYTVSVNIKRGGLHLFGFGFEALDSMGANAGTITVLNSATTVLSNTVINTNSRTNITHYGGVYSTDSCEFLFKWTAPATNIGNVSFYTAANAADGDSYTDGDYIYTNSLVLNASSSAGVADVKNEEVKFSLFPNPVVDGNVAMLYALNEPTVVAAKLLSLNGQVLAEFFMEKENTGLHQKKISISPSIKKGIYLLEMDLNGSTYFKKIEVQ